MLRLKRTTASKSRCLHV